jgi:hypothetical protein
VGWRKREREIDVLPKKANPLSGPWQNAHENTLDFIDYN